MATLEHLHQEIIDHIAKYPTWQRHDRIIEFYARLEEMAWQATKLAIAEVAMKRAGCCKHLTAMQRNAIESSGGEKIVCCDGASLDFDLRGRVVR